jgi:hypothetical protein
MSECPQTLTLQLETDMINRLKKVCLQRGLIMTMSDTHASAVDTTIEGERCQLKYSSDHEVDQGVYRVNLRHSRGYLSGRAVYVPYDSLDFDYLIVELSEYKGHFCTIPSNILAERGVLSTSTQKGRTCVSVAPPDYHKDHWSLQFWDWL